ncbi:MAG TPA: hypothetical protein VJA40_02225 [archaeon]|nr:hypothetical protein [archaeon]
MDIWLYVQKNQERSSFAKRVVQKVCQDKGITFQECDIDTVKGLTKAIEHNIISTPTVVIAKDKFYYRLSGDISETELAQNL